MCLSCSGPAVRRLLLRLELRWAVGPHGGLPGHAGGDAAAVQRADGHLLQRRPRTGALRRVARAAAAPEEQRPPGPQAHPQAGHAAAQGLVSGKVDRSFTLFLPSSMHLNLEIFSPGGCRPAPSRPCSDSPSSLSTAPCFQAWRITG